MSQVFEELQAEGFLVSDVKIREEEGEYEFTIMEKNNGGQPSFISREILSSPELRRMTEIRKKFKELFLSEYTIAGDAKMINGPHQLMKELMERAKKGLVIQRYKGLGEMNPEQLWKTTMDPDNRRLLKVRIEDVMDADDIFTILMGDKVEPRREFIQNNALEVSELDV